MSQRYDVVVVGARCAGATLATYLARQGASVLLVEQGPLFGDCVLSTHALHPPGMAVVDELGVGAVVRRVSPAMQSVRIDWHGALLDLTHPEGSSEYCPRRHRFDSALQQAALDAGAVVWDRTRVTGLHMAGERVVGVEVQRHGRQSLRVDSELVVGADGRHSTVARCTNASQYFDYDAPRGMYWSYWAAPAGWGRSDEFPAGMYIQRSGDVIRIAFHTDGDQLLVGVCPPKARLAAFREAPLNALRRSVASHPWLGPITSAPPCEPVRGYRGERYFFRQGAGPGWLLIGDAGVHKDFLGGDGMSEALLQARSAAAAITNTGSTGRDLSLEHWWRQRDVDALPLYHHARDLSAIEATPRLDRVLFHHVARDARLRAGFAAIFRREASPYTLVPPARVLGWVLKAALTGQPRVLLEFLARGRRTGSVLQSLERCRQLLHQTRPTQLASGKPSTPTVPRLPVGR